MTWQPRPELALLYPDELRERAETDDLTIHPPAPAATEHHYLSTGCLHDQHDYCSNVDGIAGLKKPAQCKFCTAPCQCHTTTKEN